MKRDDRILLAPEIIEELRKHRQRTKVGPTALLRGCKNENSGGVTGGLISSILRGVKKTILEDQLAFIRQKWESLPDWEEVYEPLSEEMRCALRAEKTRSRTGEYKLLMGRSDIPAGLRYNQITGWLHAKGVKQVKKGDYTYVLDLWSSLATHDPRVVSRTKRGELKPGHVFLTAKHKIDLEQYKADCVSWIEVAKGHSEVSANMISSWLGGRVVQVKKGHLEFVLHRCYELSQSPNRRIPLSDEILAELRYLDKQLKLSRKQLVEGASEVPDEFEPALISAWLNRYTRSARKDYLDFVLERYRTLCT